MLHKNKFSENFESFKEKLVVKSYFNETVESRPVVLWAEEIVRLQWSGLEHIN